MVNTQAQATEKLSGKDGGSEEQEKRQRGEEGDGKAGGVFHGNDASISPQRATGIHGRNSQRQSWAMPAIGTGAWQRAARPFLREFD